MSVFLNDWAQDGQSAMLGDFGVTEDVLEGAEILVASYTYEQYSGDAYVLFRRDGKLWEVHGSHCSCHGLESQSYQGNAPSQWEPEETTREAILHRLDRGRWGEEGKVADATRAALAVGD